jgi:vitamin B12 transporter
MKALGIALCLLTVAADARTAPGVLHGAVHTPDGSPVAAAQVSILGRDGLAHTDAEGRFVWAGRPRPPFEVLVVLATGQVALPVRVDALPTDGPLRIEINPAVREAVTVTAGGAPNTETTPAAGRTLLGAEEMERRAPESLVAALENVPGVARLSEGRAAVPAVRGLAHGRTLLLIDGARVTSERRVGPSATFLDPELLASVEVSRGPGAVAYGSDALGGVVHARTRRAEPGSGFSGRAAAALGAGTPEQRASVALSQGFDRAGLQVQAHYRNSDDYDSPEGEVLNSGAGDRGGRARFDQLLGSGLLSVSWQSDVARDVERPRTNSRSVRFYYPEETSHRLVASYDTSAALGFDRVGASAFLGSYSLVTDQDAFPTDTSPRSVERADVSARDFHVRGQGHRSLGETRLEVGFDVNGRFALEALDVFLTGNPDGSLSERVDISIADARRVDTGLYAVLEGEPAERLELTGGLRFDRIASRNHGGFFGDRSTQKSAVSGFAAASAGPFAGLTAIAQVARGFRDPTVSDRFFRGPTGRGFITGNPDLDPETSLQLDFALRYGSPDWNLALFAYHYRIDDLVERYEDEPDFFFFRNRGRARVRGLELEAQGRRAGFSLELSAHLLRGTALDDAMPLDDIPPPTLTVRLTRELTRGYLQLRGALFAEDDRPGPTEEPRTGYGLLDLAAGLEVTRELELRLVARNLLDESYLLSTDRRSPLAPGRSALISAVLTF